jgi:ABC-type antimicrobial peptide transport system permease subunit
MLGRLFGILSFFGTTMSALGLCAAIYYIVSSRRRELGIRVALGATGLRIVQLVAVPAFGIIAGGTTIGLLAAYVLAGVLRSWMFGVESLDPASYVGATLLLAFVAAAACVAPARAALAADPVATLREE